MDTTGLEITSARIWIRKQKLGCWWQERIVSILKLASAIKREDYEDAARLKVAIAAAATNDTVGRVMSHLKKSLDKERYEDASLIRDCVGTGFRCILSIAYRSTQMKKARGRDHRLDGGLEFQKIPVILMDELFI